MKTESDIQQPRVLIEPLDGIMARIVLNTNETKTESGYTYDRYTKNVIDRPALQQMVEQNFDAWVADCARQEQPATPTLEERVVKIETVIDGAPPLVEMIEALNILLGE